MSYNYRQLLCASVCCAGDMTSACYSWLFIFSLGVSCELFCHLRCVVWCVSQRRTKSCQRNCLGQGQPNAQSQSRILHSCFFALVSACSCRFIEDACRVPTLISFFHRIILLRILLLHTMRSTKIVSLHLFLSLSLLLLYSQLHWCGRRAWWEIAFFVLFGFFPRIALSWDVHNCSKRTDAVAVVIIITIVIVCRMNSLSGGDAFTPHQRLDARCSYL